MAPEGMQCVSVHFPCPHMDVLERMVRHSLSHSEAFILEGVGKALLACFKEGCRPSPLTLI